MKIFKGIGVSPGVVIGSILRLSERQHIKRYHVVDTDREKKRFDNAVSKVSLDLEALAESFSGYDEEVKIFFAHKTMVNDSVFRNRVYTEIDAKRCNAEAAVWDVINEFAANFKGEKLEFDFRVDMYDIARRLISVLEGTYYLNIPNCESAQIAFSYNLAATDILHLHKMGIKGLATNSGSYISHSAILARVFNMPYVVDLHNAYLEVEDGSIAIVDGNEGIFILSPDESTIALYKDRCHPIKTPSLYKKPKVKERTTKSIEILANVGLLEELVSVKEQDIGIGLFRTELLYLDRNSFPNEDEQFEIYKEIVSQVPHVVTIRTFDLSGEQLFGVKSSDICTLRGIRLLLHYEKLFTVQLSALLRASEYGNLRILLPLVTTLAELRRTREILDEIQRHHKKHYNYKLGVMVETPAAALSIEQLCSYVDFVSIGTNDLLQYTFVVSRTEHLPKQLYLPFEPVFLRLLKNIAEVAKGQGKVVCICGELASEPLFVPIFLAFGLDELSMPPQQINKIKCLLENLDYCSAKEWVENAMKLQTAEQIHKYLENKMKNFWR